MMFKIKVVLVGILYLLGGLFMVIFPPRNFNVKNKSPGLILRRTALGNHTFLEQMSSSVVQEIAQGVANLEPNFVKYFHLQTLTSEGKALGVLEVRNDFNVKKKGILVIGALDPMVWAAPNSILELAQMLLYGDHHNNFLTDYDWYLIPVGNPDGLDFTLSLRDLPVAAQAAWHRNMSAAAGRPAMWHKNLGPEGSEDSDNAKCFGVHVNRNFAFHWQDEVSPLKANSCAQSYHGDRPFSTPEARAIREYVDNLEDTIHMAIHLSATFSPQKECIVYPWRYADRRPSHAHRLQTIGEAAAREARLPDGRLFEVHQSSADGKVAGSFEDYMMGVVGTELVFVVRPYHEAIPNSTHFRPVEKYMTAALSAVFGLVRGWRATTKHNTLSFFGEEKQF